MTFEKMLTFAIASAIKNAPSRSVLGPENLVWENYLAREIIKSLPSVEKVTATNADGLVYTGIFIPTFPEKVSPNEKDPGD